MLYSRELWSIGWEPLLKEAGLPLSPAASIIHCLSLLQNFQVSVSGLEVIILYLFSISHYFCLDMANSKVGVAVPSILREERACISRFCKRGYIISRHSICQEAVSSLKVLKFNLGNVSLWDQAQVTVVEDLEGFERRRGEKRREKRRKKNPRRLLNV